MQSRSTSSRLEAGRHDMLRRASCTIITCALCWTSAQEDPGDPYLLRGIEAYQAGDLQVAHDAFATCLKLSAARTDCMTNLASVLDDMDNKQAAEELYRAVLATRETVLGRDHPSTLLTRQNLATTLKRKSRALELSNRLKRKYPYVTIPT